VLFEGERAKKQSGDAMMRNQDAMLRGEAWAKRTGEDRACDVKSVSSPGDRYGGTETNARRCVTCISRREG
jgi:hypothetical protein